MKNYASTEYAHGTKVHKFELAGLGKAPYKFLGVSAKTYNAHPGAPTQVGGSCCYCATGIVYHFYLRSADGKEFHVGSDCIEKVGDAGLMRIIDPIVKKHKAELAAANAKKKIEAAEDMLADPEVREALELRPHPFGFKRLTELDYVNFLLEKGGTSGKVKAAKMVKAALTKARAMSVAA